MHGPARNLVIAAAATAACLVPTAGSEAIPRDALFQDRLFQRCINWMLDGTGGALIDNLCIDNYGLPPPSLFLCARKVSTGFPSERDQEGCALIFEEQARKVRAGFVR